MLRVRRSGSRRPGRPRRNDRLACRGRSRSRPDPVPTLAGRAQSRRPHGRELGRCPGGVRPDGRVPLSKTSRSPAVAPDWLMAPGPVCGCTSSVPSKPSTRAWWSSRMSEDSSPPPPVPLATWNPACGVWETPQASLLCAHSVPYSAPWPTSGSMRAGACFAPLKSEPRTAVSASSSPPGPPGGPPLLKTPTSNLATNGGSQHPAKRKQGGHGPNLADEVEWLLPTPKASDGAKGSPNQRHGNGDLTLSSAAARLLPTPRASDTGTPGRRPGAGFRPPLSAVVLPMFTAQTPTDEGRGDRTPPPSPDGRGQRARHPDPRMRRGASARCSSSGCKGLNPAG